MKAAVVDPLGLENLHLEDLPEPVPGPGEVLVAIRAAALNYRDLLAVRGGYGSLQKRARLIPLSDGAGEVVAVGPGVQAWKPGDRVVGCFFPDWQAGPLRPEVVTADLGARSDGVAVERRLFRESALVRVPDALSDAEAASLPCAAATAWNAVVTAGRVGPGDRVLIQGTGGVSLFALQFARLAGAEIFAITSTPEKADLLRGLGAHHVVTYREDPDWGRTIRRLSGGRGMTHAVEVGGAGTLRQTMHAMAMGGFVAMVGVVAGPRAELNVPVLAMSGLRLEGVTAGSRMTLEALIAAMVLHGVRPVLDPRRFRLETLREALDHLASGRHIGKILVEIA